MANLDEKRSTRSVTDRVSGLDSLRFVCAMWVFFSHGADPPLVDALNPDSPIGLMARVLYNNFWNGPAAVIIFFVISGFCIHYPHTGTLKSLHLAEFYSRRMLRLLLPVAVAIPLSSAIGIKLDLFQESILWSLLAELIYYLLYPGLRVIHLRCRSWAPIIVVAYAASLAVVLTNPTAGNYPSYGAALNWLLGLPCWLLGCALAESVRRQALPTISQGALWLWRVGILGLAWGSRSLQLHSPIGYPWTLNLFALVVAAWLLREISFRRITSPTAWLEWAGNWSYSLYLLHPAAGAFCDRIFPTMLHGWLHWILLCSFVLATCYLFYLVVERPSHLLARHISRSLRSLSFNKKTIVKV
ncbi:MAG: acyltransferase [Scytolyngbya sp. HA4215-MV1]|nr:acyltransferase [Scytolyngbya sp. HA4215-MV1]